MKLAPLADASQDVQPYPPPAARVIKPLPDNDMRLRLFFQRRFQQPGGGITIHLSHQMVLSHAVRERW